MPLEHKACFTDFVYDRRYFSKVVLILYELLWILFFFISVVFSFLEVLISKSFMNYENPKWNFLYVYNGYFFNQVHLWPWKKKKNLELK